MHLTTLFIVGFIPLELLAALFVLYVALICYWGLRSAIEEMLSPILERRRMKRTQQHGDVTTELATAPGEVSSHP